MERFAWLFLSLVLHAIVCTTSLAVYTSVYRRRKRSKTNVSSSVVTLEPEFRSAADVTTSPEKLEYDSDDDDDDDDYDDDDDDDDDDGHSKCDVNACLQHANDLEEMAKAVEYLHKVNEKNEREIQNKAESISLLERRIYELNRQYQDLQKTMKEHGVKHNVEKTLMTPPQLLMSTIIPGPSTSNSATPVVTPATREKATKKSRKAAEKAEKKAEKKSKKKLQF